MGILEDYVILDHERVARTVRCKTCGAPKGYGCNRIEWEPSDGQFTPVLCACRCHAKRFKWASRVVERFGKQAVQP